MSADHERFADWDAAYVLGSLSAADREQYEKHLVDCARCTAAIAELAPMPGLLARVPRERAASMLASGSVPERPDPGRRSEIVGIGEARIRRSRRRRWVAVGATAALIAGVLLVPWALTSQAPPAVALEAVADVPVAASVHLDDVAWGTRVRMTCRYEKAADAPADGWEYELVIIGIDGSETSLSTWRAYPERTAEISAGTALRASDIAAVEVRSVKTGAVLLSSAPEVSGGDAPYN